jgi:hypothetical protein
MVRVFRARVALVAVALLAAACGDGGAAADRSGPVAEAPAAPPASGSPAPVDRAVDRPVTAREGELADVRIVAGWDPYAVFAEGFSPWVDGAAMEVTDWIEHLLIARRAPDGAARIEVDVAIEREPGPCFAFHRPVTAVRVEAPSDPSGRAGVAIGAELLAVAEREAARLDEYRAPAAELLDWCLERFRSERVGFHIVEVHAEACALPDSSGVVCATVGVFGYHLGTREFWFGETSVFDAATGVRLARERLLAPYDPELLENLFARIRDEVPLEIDHLVEYDVVASDLDLLPLSDDADVIPTAEGMVWRWSPYTHLVGSIDLIVPWDVLESVRRR